MSFFDQRYYALNKFHLTVLGVWPEQPRWVRNIWPLTMFAMCMSMIGLTIITMVKAWGDMDGFITPLPYVMIVVLNYTKLFNCVLKSDKMKLMLEKIELDWRNLENTPAIVVLHRFAERGRFLTAAYTVYIYSSLGLYLLAPFLPMVLDIVKPLNETRPKDFLYETDYGFDREPYFWPILAHAYLGSILTISIVVAADTMYAILVEHACALFEIVGFNLNLETADYMAGRMNLIGIHNDHDYQKICDCIRFHNDAIRFADMIENLYSGTFVAIFGISMITMSLTGVQALIKINHPEIMLRLVSFSLAQAFHLYFNSMPGQKLMDHSLHVHDTAYGCQWYHISLNAKKLLIPIMVRSVRPCSLTAGNVYIISMENFSQIMQTAASYFMMFSSLR